MTNWTEESLVYSGDYWGYDSECATGDWCGYDCSGAGYDSPCGPFEEEELTYGSITEELP